MAVPVTVEFGGLIRFVVNDTLDPVIAYAQPGDPFSGTFTMDDETEDSDRFPDGG